MKRVLISSLEGGEILAQGVWDDKGVQLLATNTTYKRSYFNILNSLGINYIYIKEELTATNPVIKKEFNPELLRKQSKELITRQLQRFENSGSVNIYKFEKFVFTVMNEILDSINIIENMYSIKNYNNYTYEHSINVTVIGIMLCSKMDFSRYETYEVAMGCILHDLGKMKVAEGILNKPAILTTEEFEEIKKHPIDGYNIIKNKKHLSKQIKEIILTHHEKLDGSGYPLGLVGDDISIGTRICSIADVFDAMCSERPYKAAVPFAESIRTIRTSMNKQLDMDICTVLEEILSSE